MKKYFLYCFDKWWRPILFAGFTFFLIVINFLGYISHFNFFFLLFCLGLLILIISLGYQFYKKRWWLSAVSFAFVILIVFGFLIFLFLNFMKTQTKPDGYADNLVIPSGIKYNLPTRQYKPSEIDSIDFHIYSIRQPGIYGYVVWTKKINRGIVYLKVFEVTKNESLSAKTIKEHSSLFVYNPTNKILMFQLADNIKPYNKDFTIFEGDWGKPYLARFELWYLPENGGQEIKLSEKIYKIEGWQF